MDNKPNGEVLCGATPLGEESLLPLGVCCEGRVEERREALREEERESDEVVEERVEEGRRLGKEVSSSHRRLTASFVPLPSGFAGEVVER